jgi:cell division protein ZapA
MSDAEPITIQILDKDYRVVCGEDEQAALVESAKYLDLKMREIRDSGKVIGADRIAVMAALNIANEMLQQLQQREQVSRTMTTRIRTLEDKIDTALNRSQQLEL